MLINGQKAFGQDRSISDVFDYFRLKLESRFSVDQILFALNKYTDRRNDIPAPSDIIEILNPPPPRVSQAEYIAAQRWQEINGRSQFTAEADLIRRYERQQDEDRAAYGREIAEINRLASDPESTDCMIEHFESDAEERGEEHDEYPD